MNLLDDTNQDDQVQIDPNKNYLDELVGEGKKFKTVEDLARGKAEADTYIEHFKQRHDELRDYAAKLKSEYEAGPSLKELIDQLKASKTSNNDNTQSVHEDKSEFDLNKIEDLISNKIQQTKTLEREEQNYATVQAKLIEQWGPNYAQQLKSQVSQLGLTADFVNDLARKHPTVLFKTLGLDGQRRSENFQAPPQSSQRSDPFSTSGPKRTWTYYEKMRKAEPLKYFDPKIQDQMFNDANSMGDAFNDGDFRKHFG